MPTALRGHAGPRLESSFALLYENHPFSESFLKSVFSPIQIFGNKGLGLRFKPFDPIRSAALGERGIFCSNRIYDSTMLEIKKPRMRALSRF